MIQIERESESQRESERQGAPTLEQPSTRGERQRATRTIWTGLIYNDDEVNGDHEGQASQATSDEDNLDWTDL